MTHALCVLFEMRGEWDQVCDDCLAELATEVDELRRDRERPETRR
jgi:hypothetical protein